MTREEIISRCQTFTVDECIAALELYGDAAAQYAVNAWYKGRDLADVLPDLRQMCIERQWYTLGTVFEWMGSTWIIDDVSEATPDEIAEHMLWYRYHYSAHQIDPKPRNGEVSTTGGAIPFEWALV